MILHDPVFLVLLGLFLLAVIYTAFQIRSLLDLGLAVLIIGALVSLPIMIAGTIIIVTHCYLDRKNVTNKS